MMTFKIGKEQLDVPPPWYSREELPFILNDLCLTGMGVEIGVQRGVNLSRIRQHWNGDVVHGVDPWKKYYGVRDSDEQHDAYMKDAYDAMMSTGKGFVLHRMNAVDFADMARDSGLKFDFVYLDGDHDEEPLRREIGLYWPLVSDGGILAGHDYQPNGWIRDEQPTIAYATEEEAGIGQHCGPFFVKRVVDETFPIDMVSITSPEADRGWRSWMVRKFKK